MYKRQARQVEGLVPHLQNAGNVAQLLARHPEHRAAVRRVQLLYGAPLSPLHISDPTRQAEMSYASPFFKNINHHPLLSL